MRKHIENLRISSQHSLSRARDALDALDCALPCEDEFDRVTIAVAMELNDVSRSYANLADKFGTWSYGDACTLANRG